MSVTTATLTAAEIAANPKTEREQLLARYALYWANEAKRLSNDRSMSLNKFYWAHVVREFCMANGDHGARAEMAQHEMWKARFLPMWAKSTTKLSKEDFALFVDRCIQDAAEHGVFLMYPSEVGIGG